MRTMICGMTMLLCFASCAESLEGADAGVSTITEGVSTITEAVSSPDTVCGLPTQCQSYNCWIDITGYHCNVIQDPSSACRSACGTWNATCPDGPTTSDCLTVCNGNDFGVSTDVCMVACMGARRSCQFGVTN